MDMISMITAYTEHKNEIEKFILDNINNANSNSKCNFHLI